jgi:hypothetical protein
MHIPRFGLIFTCLVMALMSGVIFFSITATNALAQTPCTDAMIWGVFPTAKELPGVNDQLLNKIGPTVNADGTRSFAKRWSAGSTSRSVNITVTEYPDTAAASQEVHVYGFDDQKGQVKTGMVKLSFGDEGYKTDDIKRPYYLVHQGQFTLSYYTSYPGRGGGIPGDQDPTVQKIIQKIAALPCLGAPNKPPPPSPPPPANKCPTISLKASPSNPTPSQIVILTANATDPEGDSLTLKWAVMDAKGTKLNVAWNGKVATGSGQVKDTVSWKNPAAGKYNIRVSVSDGKCGKTETASTQVLIQAGMNVSVKTDKTTYSPGETVIIQGHVKDQKGGLKGAAVAVDVAGKLIKKKTDASGNYRCEFSIPSAQNLSAYKVTATASYAGYPDKTESTSFSVLQAMTVEIRTNKDHYLIGEKVYCTITVKDGSGTRIPGADLKIEATRLVSGKIKVINAWTDGLGEYPWRFIWGQRNGKPIAEGKLQVKVIASKRGYGNGNNEITILGCGDFEYAKEEDCFNCPEECKCPQGLICDPWCVYADANGCSPKMAYVMINPYNVSYFDYAKMGYWVEGIKKYYKKKGYKVASVMLTKGDELAQILAGPSSKAIAYFGHSDGPKLGGNNAARLSDHVFTLILKRYIKRGMDKAEAEKRAKAYAKQLNFDEAYIATCYSFADESLALWLLKRGGIYWGERDKLFYLNELDKYRRQENSLVPIHE